MLTLLLILAPILTPSPAQHAAIESPAIELARPRWAFAEPRTPVALDAELAAIGGVSPFESDAVAFEEGGR